jgi:osmotically inducible protein OsmC
MPVRTAEATWTGSLKEGKGHVKGESGKVDATFSFNTRMGDEKGTNPEELIGAAHAGCFSMAFSAGLGAAGFAPRTIHTVAKVTFGQQDGGWGIQQIALATEADVPGLEDAKFQELAKAAKEGCPVSKALASVPITLEAKLLASA